MKILIAEDDTTSRLVLAATLKKAGHEVAAVKNGREAWEMLQEGDGYSLVISDWMMPDMDGLELCRHIRAQHSNAYTYIILLSALSGKTNYLGAMDAGADDFITKPFDAEQLEARLRVAGRILDLHQTLRTNAMYDSLTGLLNRAAIMDSLQQELDRAARESKTLGVLLSDVDYFKRVNDTHGHAAGDAVLREVAQRLRRSLRSYDKIGRYGGEEFLLVLPTCDEKNGLALAERLRHAIEATPVSIGAEAITVTASMGIAIGSAGSQGRMDALIQAADAALYRAKAGGRNRVELAEPEPEMAVATSADASI
jgi:diguanylate cyclase (GGDEF)-like protein